MQLQAALNFVPSQCEKKEEIFTTLDDLRDQKGLLAIGLNIRSLLAKFEQVELLLEKNNIDILSINESWLGRNIGNNHIRIRDYKVYRHDRNLGKKRGGGIVVYVEKNLKVNAQIYMSSTM